MKALFILLVLIFLTPVSAGFDVEWTNIYNGISHKEYLISIQNLETFNNYFDISVLINSTNFDLEKINNMVVYEWKGIEREFPVYVFEDAINYYPYPSKNESEFIFPDGCWNVTANLRHYICSEKIKVLNGTELKKICEWKQTKMNLVVHPDKVKAGYGNILIPKIESKPKFDDFGNIETENGIKKFKLSFDIPIIETESGWGSVGCVGIVEETSGDFFHPEWNESYPYRQHINITNIGGNITDLQMLFEINDSNAGDNWNWSNNGSDSRFTNLTGGEMFLWFEDWNATINKTEVWSKTHFLENNTITKIYMYYGNDDVSSASDITNTMIFGDDFDDNTFNVSKWNNIGTANITYSDGIVKVASTGASWEGMLSDNKFGKDVIWETRGLITVQDIDQKLRWLGLSEIENQNEDKAMFSVHRWGDDLYKRVSVERDNSETQQIGINIENVFNRYTIKWKTDEAKFYINNSLVTTLTSNVPTQDLYVGSGCFGGTDYYTQMDWVFLRKYASIEPTYIIGSEEKAKIYPTLNWTLQPEINLTDETNPTFLFNMSNVNLSTVIFYSGLNDTLTGNFNKSFRYFKDSYILRNLNRNEGDTLSENNAIKYYTNDIGSYGSFRYSLNQKPVLKDSGDNWYLFNFTANYHCLLENHIPIDRTNLTKELKTSQYLEILKDNPAIIKLRTFPLEVNRTIHINVNIDDQTALKPLIFYVCNNSINPETVNPITDNNCGFLGTKTDFDIKDRVLYNSSYVTLHFGINENGYLNLNGGIKSTDTMFIVMYSENTVVSKAYKLYFADDNNFNDTFLMFKGSSGWTFTNRSETPDLIYSVTGDYDRIVYYVHACNTSDMCKNFTLQVESLGARPNESPTTPLLLTPVYNEKVNETYNITWLDGTDTEGDYFNITILLYWNGILNHTLANNNITNGTEYFEWNTTGFNDSDLYEIIIYATDSGGLSSDTTTSGYFEIDNIPTIPILTYTKKLYFYPDRRFYYQ